MSLGSQCSRNPVEESDYCSLHLKKSEISDGGGFSRQGLWLGRIDKDRPVQSADGTELIKWKTYEDVIKNSNSKSKTKSKTDSPAMKKLNKMNKEKKPKNARSAYIFYQQEQYKILKQDNPTLKMGELSKLIGAQWKSLSEQEKSPYVQLADKDKVRAQKERKVYEVISSLPSGILVFYDGTDHYRLSKEQYEAVCNATKLIPQRAIMAAHFLNYEAYELYTINGNKIDDTFVKWVKEKNKCFAGYAVSGNNVGVNKKATVSGEVLSFLSTGIDTRVYFIKNF